MTITYHAGRRIQGLSTDNAITSGLSAWTPVTFNNSTIVNGMSATGNVLSSANVTGSWTSYIRSNEYISPSTGGGEFYFTGQSQPPSLAIGFEKSPFNEYPSAVYQNANFGWHVTHVSAGNDIYEKTSLYNITPAIIDASVSKITMDSAGLVKYYVDDVLVRTSTVTASGNYYINASFSGASADTASVYIKTPISASLTNVQAGSRFEETDTRKIYYSSKVHTFLLADTGTSFTPSASGNVEYLVIGGGGGGGAIEGAGGGAGGYRTASGFPVTAQAYTITVGAGGAGGNNGGSNGVKGNDSIFSSITSTGGGYGATSGGGSFAGGAGGSGGGGAGGGSGGISSPVTSPVQGYAGGGSASGGNYPAGGGAGSSVAGGTGSGSVAGSGGNGTASSITGSSITRAGGGGGATFSGGTAGTGGSGGGGAGGGNPVAGTVNTGSGGGGAWNNGTTPNGGIGGSGIVIIKYSSGVNATGGTITTVWTEEA